MNCNLIDNRQIRVFISSTFQDMQDERDYLMNKTFPMLKHLAAERNVSIVEVDLRWGITKELSENNKTLQVCLNEIDNSRPFFIGILGDRYGWCPAENEYYNNRTIQDQYRWVLDCINKGKSVTEMEIQYGALNHEIRGAEDVQAFFYIKENSDETDVRLHELKEAVRNNIDKHPCTTYSSSSDLGEQIYQTFKRILDTLYPEKKLSVLERLQMEQESFIASRCNLYISNERDEKKLDGFLYDDKETSLLVVAPSGMGKSALLANWIANHREEKRYEWFYHFIGNTSDNCRSEEIALHLAMEIQQRQLTLPTDLPKKDNEKDYDYLQRTIEHLNPEKNIMIVLDGFDHLKNFEVSTISDWLPMMPKGSKIIVSSVEESVESFKRKKYKIYKLNKLTIAKRQEIVSKYLRRYGKELTQIQEKRIARYSQNPMVLRTILNEVRLFGNFERLDSHITELVSHPSVESLFDAILQKAEHDYDCDLVKKSLSWIRLSLAGIGESDILNMLGCLPLNWSQFYCAYVDLFIVRDGTLNFSNKMISEAVKRRYLNVEKDVRKDFARVLRTAKNIPYNYAQKELAYQYYLLKEWDNLFKIIRQPLVFMFYYKNAVSLLSDFWTQLLKQGKNYSISCYLRQLSEPQENSVKFHQALASFCLGWFPYESHGTAQKAYTNIIKIYERKKRKSINEKLDMINAYIQGAIILSDYYKQYDNSCCAIEYALDKLSTIKAVLTPEMKQSKADALFSLGNNKAYQSKLKEAVSYYQQAQKLFIELYGKGSKENIECLINIGNAYCDLYVKNKQEKQYFTLSEKYYSEAISLAEEKFDSGKNTYISEFIWFGALINNLGSLYIAAEQYDKAKKECSTALSILHLYEGINSQNILNYLLDCLYNMGIICMKQQMYKQALPYFEEALSRAKSKINDNPVILDYVFRILKKIIQVHKDLNDIENVEKYKREALLYLHKFFPEKEYDELKNAWTSL